MLFGIQRIGITARPYNRHFDTMEEAAKAAKKMSMEENTEVIVFKIIGSYVLTSIWKPEETAEEETAEEETAEEEAAEKEPEESRLLPTEQFFKDLMDFTARTRPGWWDRPTRGEKS